MDSHQIKRYLQGFKGKNLRTDIIDELTKLKYNAVSQGDQEEAKNIWCLEQIYKVINHYLVAYKNLFDKNYFEAWCELDRADIELSFLRRHYEYSENKFNLEFIEKNIIQLQKLFPYKHFFSRESTTKKWKCSICNNPITLRNSCGHEVGEIYNGEQCGQIAEDIEFHGLALVTDPFDKYTVIFPEGKEYNYFMLENLMKYWTNPYEKWELQTTWEVNEEYKNLSRNDYCKCDSGIKYKNCCLNTDQDRHEHHKLLFLEKDPNTFKPMKKQTFNTWKS